jgi:hypothetical protein
LRHRPLTTITGQPERERKGHRIAAIPHALSRHHSDGTGNTVSAGGFLNGPLGLAIAPRGDILTVNSGDGNLVETTPGGVQVAHQTITPGGAGVRYRCAENVHPLPASHLCEGCATGSGYRIPQHHLRQRVSDLPVP